MLVDPASILLVGNFHILTNLTVKECLQISYLGQNIAKFLLLHY